MQKQVQFVKPAYTKTMIQIKVDGEQKNRWCNADPAVYNWAKQKEASKEYKEGDIVTIEYEQRGDIWYVTKLTKGNEASPSGTDASQTPPDANPPVQTGVVVCSKCNSATKYISGTKNGKPWAGNKCTSCDNVDWCKAGDPPPPQAVVPEEQKTQSGDQQSGIGCFVDKPEIVSENITTAVSQTLIALQGHVNPSNVDGLIESLHAMYLKNATKNIKTLKSGI